MLAQTLQTTKNREDANVIKTLLSSESWRERFIMVFCVTANYVMKNEL